MLIRGEQRLELLVDLISLVFELALLVLDPLHAHAPALVVLLLRREFGARALRQGLLVLDVGVQAIVVLP